MSRSLFNADPPELVFNVDSDGFLELVTLTETLTGDAVESAAVTAVIQDAGGDPVSGIDNPLTLIHDAGGTYRGLIPDTASLEDGDRIIVVIAADDGPARRQTFKRTGIILWG